MNKVLIIDHYDSFSYNLQQYCSYLGAEVVVKKCDDILLKTLETNTYTHIIFSPGPGSVYSDSDMGHSAYLLQNSLGQIPMLGVCLGHQLMAASFGAKIIQVDPRHGKKDRIKIKKGATLFHGLGDTIEGMRYHSMVVNPDDESLLVLAGWVLSAHSLRDGYLMAMEQPAQKLYGVQFHPESIGTGDGIKILENFLKL